MNVDIIKVGIDMYLCDICQEHIAHIKIDFDRYTFTICKHCFNSFDDGKALVILQDIKRDRKLHTFFDKITNLKKGESIIFDEGVS